MCDCIFETCTHHIFVKGLLDSRKSESMVKKIGATYTTTESVHLSIVCVNPTH